jgi:hypothetical protein
MVHGQSVCGPRSAFTHFVSAQITSQRVQLVIYRANLGKKWFSIAILKVENRYFSSYFIANNPGLFVIGSRLDLGYQLSIKNFRALEFLYQKKWTAQHSKSPKLETQGAKIFFQDFEYTTFFRTSEHVWWENEGNRRRLLFCVVWERAAFSRYVLTGDFFHNEPRRRM